MGNEDVVFHTLSTLAPPQGSKLTPVYSKQGTKSGSGLLFYEWGICVQLAIRPAFFVSDVTALKLIMSVLHLFALRVVSGPGRTKGNCRVYKSL